MPRRWPILATLALSCLLVPEGASAQWTLGAQAGLARSKVSGDAPSKVHYRNRWGPSISAIVEYAFTPSVALSFEPGYAQRGTGLAVEVQDVKEPVDTADLSLSYLTLPVLAKVYSPGGRAFVTAGVEVGYLLSADLEFEGSTESLQEGFTDTTVSAVFGVGTRFRAGPAEWLLSLSYVQGVPSLVGEDPGDGEGFFPDRFRGSGLEFSGGVLFQLGGGR